MDTADERVQKEIARRVYYQDIVYAVCNSLDRIFGNRVARGEGVVCGTLETPSTSVQDLLPEVELRCREWCTVHMALARPSVAGPAREKS